LIENFQARFDLQFSNAIVIAIEILIRIDRTLVESTAITFFNRSRSIALRPVPLGGLVAQEGGITSNFSFLIVNKLNRKRASEN
jgi:hypothetical protein